MDLNNNLFKNWIKSAYGFHFVKFGLDDFVSNELVQHHQHLKELVRQRYSNVTSAQSSVCTFDNLYPDHGGAGQCNHKYRRDCIDHRKSKKGRRLCPNNFCGYFYHLIVNDHVESTPRWTCTDMTRWSVDWFEYAKCFLGNHTSAKSFYELDCASVLSIILHHRHLRNMVVNVDAFKKCRENRNIIFHSANYEVSDQDCARYIDTMIAVLGDKKCLKDNDKAKQMIICLKELNTKSTSITKADEIGKLIEESQKAIDAIVKERNLARCEIKELIDQVKRVKVDAVDAIDDAVNKIDERFEKHEKLCKMIMECKNKHENSTTPQDLQIDTSMNGPTEEAVSQASKMLIESIEAMQSKNKTSTQIEKKMQGIFDKFSRLNAVFTRIGQHQKSVRTTFRCSTLADMLSCIQYLNSEECLALLKETAQSLSDKIGQTIDMRSQAVEASVKRAIDRTVRATVDEDGEGNSILDLDVDGNVERKCQFWENMV